MDRKDDTMNLEAIKALLSDVPDSGEFDLDSIIAEVEGGAPAEPKQAARPAPEPAPQPASAPEPEPPVSEPEPAPRAGLFGRRTHREQAETEDEAPEQQAPAAHAPKTRRARREEPVQQFPDPAAFEDAPAEE